MRQFGAEKSVGGEGGGGLCVSLGPKNCVLVCLGVRPVCLKAWEERTEEGCASVLGRKIAYWCALVCLKGWEERTEEGCRSAWGEKLRTGVPEGDLGVPPKPPI